MRFTLYADPYKARISFILGEEPFAASHYLRRMKATQPDVEYLMGQWSARPVAGLTSWIPHWGAVVYMPEVPNTASQHSVLVHEIYHAICAVLRNAGVFESQQTEEAYAYMIEHISAQVFNRIWK